ncbi:chitinase [Colletotrichum truncatum]|uniref:Chitinase n=1 Tax=Colletotrichum truncatum TaxID=5467 RepID=A0ACC3Z1U9_COLTU|nr:chitinase [Colletotrichum truncatum]KAF6781359.1 chitinase [Colletotrichum truncatum]
MMSQHRHSLLPFMGLAGMVLNGAYASAPVRDLCPITCLEAGADPANWTVIAEFSQLQACQRPMVLDFSVNVPVTDKQQIRVCNVFINDFDSPAIMNLALSSTDNDTETRQVVPQLAWTPAASEDDIGGRLVTQSVEHLKSYLSNVGQTSDRLMLFGTVSDTTVGVYVGANLLRSSVSGDLFTSFLNNLYSTGIADSKSALVQVCNGYAGNDIFGLIAASSADFSAVHNAVGQWSNGSCVDTSSYAETRVLETTSISFFKPEIAPNPRNGTAAGNSTVAVRGLLQARAECRTVTVDDGDDCGKLVTRCGGGLTAADFYKFNPNSKLCSTLQPGQRVCCTAGELPDIRPKQNADGSCYKYQIKKGDFCNKVAVANGLTVQELEDLNKETWGWGGCDNGFWPDNWICLSKGTPPFPSPIPNADCGPQKPGTVQPSGSTSRDWAKLNPCPLNSCCNIWGQCGTTTDFCVDTNTGPPGTAKKDTFGCISNCGMSIIQSGPPAQFIKLGYFEGFNLGSRDCLNMDASQIDPSYTHVHFAFGMINDKFEIYQENAYAEFQFQQFKKLKGPKRIISFGGWVFSAEAPNYPIFRNGVKAENRNKLADNLVKYVVDNGLDGLDLDWEYPSAPDLPDIPKGDLSEATDYLRLLALIRSKLPKDKSLSIAAPASFWYLKQFPIKAISELLDYIVYMTYDLHGQWDAGNKWASTGCPSGNCLRSHINRTETMSALTMITKAGVPSNKVLVGVSSYGRSFQMADPSCTGPNCLFTGDRKTSFARKGRCTQTGGYIANAEIDEIGGRSWIDSESNSKIMVDGDLWVSYMDDSLKDTRTQLYKRYNMGGTIDWAVDLVKFHEPPNFGAGGGVGGGVGFSWAVVKKQIMDGSDAGQIGCDAARLVRTGTWVKHQCNTKIVAAASDYTPSYRWKEMECQSGWEDAVRVWKACHADGKKGYDFSESIAEFLHISSNRRCGDLSIESNCDDSADCEAHNTEHDLDQFKTGACTYEIWNSLTELHRMIKNYYYSLINAGNELKSSHQTFINTFAPKPNDGTEILNLFLTLIPIPLNTAAARFFGSSFMATKFFAGDTGGKASMWEAATSNMVNAGSSIAKDALSKASAAREEISFKAIYDDLIGNWKEQTDRLNKDIFSGTSDSIKALNSIISGGKMIAGMKEGTGDTSNYTNNWIREANIQRAFYAAAIPAAWGANRPAPVVVDFGPSCQIDARKYFAEKPDVYNSGWRCPDGHSYILAGVRDGPQNPCGPVVPGGSGCTPTFKWTLDILKGIDQLQKDTNKWGGVTVDDLIIGAVNTYVKNGHKNVMDPKTGTPDASDKSVMGEYEGSRLDIRRGGLIRIPVCSAEEATKNLNKGRKAYGDSPNYPCNP